MLSRAPGSISENINRAVPQWLCFAMARWCTSFIGIRSRAGLQRTSHPTLLPLSINSAAQLSDSKATMTGHIFHPGHAELHGITVVVETTGSRTYVGRYDSEDERGVHMLDVGVYDPGDVAVSKEEYVKKSIKFGVRSEFRHLTIPSLDIAR